MTTAATITANLILNSRQYQQGLKTAGAATTAFQGKVQKLTAFVRQNATVISQLGDGLQQLGKKMSMFITIPIIAFFTLAIKKAMEADTAMGKMAQESLTKLNEQMAKLGEKFLPMVIKLIDFLVEGLEKFNNAPPWVQNVVLAIVALIALAGPMLSFIGTIVSATATLSTMGTTAATLIPTIVTLGTTLWAALLPVLPIILAIIVLIAGLAFVIWAFATDFMGVTTTLKQLIWLIGYSFGKMVEGLKAAWADGMAWLETETKKSSDIWANNFKQAEEIKKKLFKLSVDTMFKWWTDFSTKVTAKITEVRNFFVNAWNYAAGVFMNIFTAIANFFNAIIVGIINGINALIDAINSLGFALDNLEIPAELVPGSPTPFEMGLRGITSAMDTLSKKSLPEFNAAFATPSGVSEVGGGKRMQYVDNRRFGSGLSAEVLKLALAQEFNGLADELENGS